VDAERGVVRRSDEFVEVGDRSDQTFVIATSPRTDTADLRREQHSSVGGSQASADRHRLGCVTAGGVGLSEQAGKHAPVGQFPEVFGVVIEPRRKLDETVDERHGLVRIAAGDGHRQHQVGPAGVVGVVSTHLLAACRDVPIGGGSRSVRYPVTRGGSST
jgi:hypothetical protein